MADAQSNAGNSENAAKKGIEVKRPAKENIRDAIETENVFAADLYSPTYFPLGMRFMKSIHCAPWRGSITVFMKQTGKARACHISPICFHRLDQNPKFRHQRCFGYAFTLTGFFCVDEEECSSCKEVLKTRKYAYMETIGFRRKARSLIILSHYLEGVLLCLMYCHEISAGESTTH